MVECTCWLAVAVTEPARQRRRRTRARGPATHATADDIYAGCGRHGHIVALGASPERDAYPNLTFWGHDFVDRNAALAETLNPPARADAHERGPA